MLYKFSIVHVCIFVYIARMVAVTYAILCTNARSAIGGFMLTGAKCVLSCITQSDRYYIANVPLKEHVCFRI